VRFKKTIIIPDTEIFRKKKNALQLTFVRVFVVRQKEVSKNDNEAREVFCVMVSATNFVQTEYGPLYFICSLFDILQYTSWTRKLIAEGRTDVDIVTRREKLRFIQSKGWKITSSNITFQMMNKLTSVGYVFSVVELEKGLSSMSILTHGIAML
jgi:hypothetical protein